MGTIHSFCASLLRERPVEAGVDISFREIEPNEDLLIKERAWEDYSAKLFAKNDPILVELNDCGLSVDQLRKAFIRYTDYPDVDEWPVDSDVHIDIDSIKRDLDEYMNHLVDLVKVLPDNAGNDKLIPHMKKVVRQYRQSSFDTLLSYMDFFESMKSQTIVQKEWPSKGMGKAEKERWEKFLDEHVTPYVDRWYAIRYRIIVKLFSSATSFYEDRKRVMGVLNFQDLLLTAARLIRNHPDVREYLQKQYTHLLVDEFQDTDPIQAEMMLLLTSDDTTESNWKHCTPRPGSLFIVGDPKQSIYRFRRADIVTYNDVKEIIRSSGGTVVSLSTSFRTEKPIVDWVNTVFTKRFPDEINPFSPDYIPLLKMDDSSIEPQIERLFRLEIPEGYAKNDECHNYESDSIARFIRHEIDSNQGKPSDYLIVCPKTKNLHIYAEVLHQYGIPNQVTGGNTVNQLPELELLVLCLRAIVNSHNPIMLVSLLRSELFGFSDIELFEYKHSGGVFDYTKLIKESVNHLDRFKTVFDKLNQYSTLLRLQPLIPALEKVSSDLGLFAYASIQESPDLELGSFLKVFELLRSVQHQIQTTADALDYLESLLNQDEKFDGITASPPDDNVVRIMNLHKVKGLEAPTVFLADPTGVSKKANQSVFHIDRSESLTNGYLLIEEEKNEYQKQTLAYPYRWNEFVEIEKNFFDAEQIRLQYVASTRAGKRLIISQRIKGNHNNPWKFFANDLGDSIPLLEIPDGGPISIDLETKRTETIPSFTEVQQKWRLMQKSTYQIKRSKEDLIHEIPLTRVRSTHGQAWGEVIHTLLQIKMDQPEKELQEITETLLLEKDLDLQWKNDAIQTVNAVQQSDIWQRAQKIDEKYVEIPFNIKPKSNRESTMPTILRGSIDLVFRENGGWVIVDYKTDSNAEYEADKLMEYYRPQIENYSEAWEIITNEPVIESGLYFTAIDEYRAYPQYQETLF
jgi:ATP-dependent helicase/nuclease subunit A